MMTIMSVANHLIAYPGTPAIQSRCGEPGSPRVNSLERLIQITRSNDLLILELKQARRRLTQALDYATDPRSRPEVGEGLVSLAQRKVARIQVRLRANRAEALAILARSAD